MRKEDASTVYNPYKVRSISAAAIPHSESIDVDMLHRAWSAMGESNSSPACMGITFFFCAADCMAGQTRKAQLSDTE